jgi:hypothetical protein
MIFERKQQNRGKRNIHYGLRDLTCLQPKRDVLAKSSIGRIA